MALYNKQGLPCVAPPTDPTSPMFFGMFGCLACAGKCSNSMMVHPCMTHVLSQQWWRQNFLR
jgi:hypothetical protein